MYFLIQWTESVTLFVLLDAVVFGYCYILYIWVDVCFVNRAGDIECGMGFIYGSSDFSLIYILLLLFLCFVCINGTSENLMCTQNVL